MKTKKRILVAPLNWGLGHATRCMPIIEKLLQQNVEVWIASDGAALKLLQKEYPHLQHLELPAYNITYPTRFMLLNIGLQALKILRAVYLEHRALKKIVETHQIDAIISDNRYGCWHSSLPSIFLTHQVNLQIPTWILEKLVNWMGRLFLKPFTEIWIPDLPNTPNLAGKLSHDFQLPNARYIGVLSRMKHYPTPKKYDIGIILSGPEPQRTYLEKRILAQIQRLPHRILLVRGLVQEEVHYYLNDNIEVYGYMTSKDLNQAMLASNLIIARSGYSTVMDLVCLKKQAIFIPTPGQTEQEYLAQHYLQQGLFFYQTQQELDLERALTQVSLYHGFRLEHDGQLLDKAISTIVTRISDLPNNN